MAAPTNKERLEEHEERLAQIEAQLGLRPPEPKKTLLKQKFEWVINHKATSLILAVVLCAVGIFGKYWLDHKNEWWNHDVDERISQTLSAKGGIADTLNSIRLDVAATQTTLKDLAPFIHDVITRQFEKVSQLPTASLQERLPVVQRLLTVAKDQEIKTDLPVLNSLGKKLSTVDTKSSSFWPTAADFISYRSQIVSHDVQNLMRNDLPNCTDHDPTPMQLIVRGEEEKNGRANDILNLPDTSNETGKGNQLVTARYEDCRFILDSPEDAARVPFLRDGRSFALTFKHCQIVYRGGPIKLLTPRPRPTALTSKGDFRSDVYVFTGQRIHFENCLFLFVINVAPPSEGQWLTQQLLAQSGPLITLEARKRS